MSTICHTLETEYGLEPEIIDELKGGNGGTKYRVVSNEETYLLRQNLSFYSNQKQCRLRAHVLDQSWSFRTPKIRKTQSGDSAVYVNGIAYELYLWDEFEEGHVDEETILDKIFDLHAKTKTGHPFKLELLQHEDCKSLKLSDESIQVLSTGRIIGNDFASKLSSYGDLEEMCVVHGDLYQRNVGILNHDVYIFDWESVRLGCRLEDVATLLEEKLARGSEISSLGGIDLSKDILMQFLIYRYTRSLSFHISQRVKGLMTPTNIFQENLNKLTHFSQLLINSNNA